MDYLSVVRPFTHDITSLSRDIPEEGEVFLGFPESSMVWHRLSQTEMIEGQSQVKAEDFIFWELFFFT